jgi:hypothetical protein
MSEANRILVTVTPWTLSDIEGALRASWAADTCSPDDLDRAGWQPDNPAWGHCDITTLLLHDLLGGDLVVGEVHLDGAQHGFHWWNRLANGVELDLTREQFRRGQVITAARVVQRPAGRPARRYHEYLLLRERVAARLGRPPAPPHVGEPDAPPPMTHLPQRRDVSVPSPMPAQIPTGQVAVRYSISCSVKAGFGG